MKQDIQNKEDIILLVNTFYDHVKIDKVIGHFFIEVVDVHWETHLPKMYEFWSQILFQNGNFNGNPMQTHRHVHSLHNMTKEDFEHWLTTPNILLDNKAPMDFLDTVSGLKFIDNRLTAMEFGENV